MTKRWVRFKDSSGTRFGTLENERIRAWSGNMFENPVVTDEVVAQADVKLLAPVEPTKIIALWNNFGALSDKLGLSKPPEPLYLIKAPNSYLNPGETIRKPACDGKVVFEGELGIVIGKTCTAVSEGNAKGHIFGYTCANDVTHAEILFRDATFPQWVRAKGFDTFCPFGPVVATDLDASSLTVKTVLNGDVRQDYPISDMHYTVEQLVSLISQDMTLNPGDIILCGTSVGVGSMKPGSDVSVEIDGIGKLANRFE